MVSPPPAILSMEALAVRLPNGASRVPWGFVVGKDGHLVADTSSADRCRRTELGETAIRLLAALGVSTDVLSTMTGIEEPSAMLAKLEEART